MSSRGCLETLIALALIFTRCGVDSVALVAISARERVRGPRQRWPGTIYPGRSPFAGSPTADVWRAALLMLKRYGDYALLEASERANQLLDEGDMAGAETWHRI